MSGFFLAPQFEPVAPPLFNGADGDVLTIVSGTRAWAPGGGGVKQGYLGAYLLASPAAGAYTAYDPAGFGPTIGRLDINTGAGVVTINSLIAGADGQMLNVTNTGGNNLIFPSGGTRLPGTMYIPENDSLLLCYYAGSINLWCLA